MNFGSPLRLVHVFQFDPGLRKEKVRAPRGERHFFFRAAVEENYLEKNATKVTYFCASVVKQDATVQMLHLVHFLPLPGCLRLGDI